VRTGRRRRRLTGPSWAGRAEPAQPGRCLPKPEQNSPAQCLPTERASFTGWLTFARRLGCSRAATKTCRGRRRQQSGECAQGPRLSGCWPAGGGGGLRTTGGGGGSGAQVRLSLPGKHSPPPERSEQGGARGTKRPGAAAMGGRTGPLFGSARPRGSASQIRPPASLLFYPPAWPASAPDWRRRRLPCSAQARAGCPGSRSGQHTRHRGLRSRLAAELAANNSSLAAEPTTKTSRSRPQPAVLPTYWPAVPARRRPTLASAPSEWDGIGELRGEERRGAGCCSALEQVELSEKR